MVLRHDSERRLPTITKRSMLLLIVGQQLPCSASRNGCKSRLEILTPALTPLMCGLAPLYTGATPVFVDSCPDTFLMNPDDIVNKITNKTKIILITHMYGGVCNMKIMDI